MRKAVAVPYIIALILGVIVVGILGYWFISQGGKTIGIGTKAECDAKQFQFCQSWRNNRFGTEPAGFAWDSCLKPNKPQCASKLGCSYGGGCDVETQICFYNGNTCPSSVQPTCPHGTVKCPK